MMKEAVVVSAVRTAVGKAPKGTLRYTRPDDLGAIAVKGAVDRVPALDPKEIEDVIIGCAMPEGEQGMNMARLISLRAGLPIEAAAMTVNRYCASGLQTIALAAERIRGGGAEVIVAGGAESMSYLPMGGNKIAVNPWLMDNHPAAYMSMGLTAERVAKHYDIGREESDQFALASHKKALAAIEAGRFDDEIVAVPVVTTVMSAGESRRSRKSLSPWMRDRGLTHPSRRWQSYALCSMPLVWSPPATARRLRMARRLRYLCRIHGPKRSGPNRWRVSFPSHTPGVSRRRWAWARSMRFRRR